MSSMGTKNKPLVSVLLAAYKVNVHFLYEAIDSILHQTYENFELLILYQQAENDGMYEVFSRINDKRVRIIKTNVNPWNFPEVLNVGLDEAKGKYIARMDADDIALPLRFEKQVRYMEKNQRATVVGGRIKFTGKKGFDLTHLLTPDERAIAMLFSNETIAHPTAMIRADYLANNGIRYRHDKWGAEDYYLWSDIVSHGGEIHCIKDLVLEYRQHEGQVTRTMNQTIKNLIKEVRLIQVSRYTKLTEEEKKAFLAWDGANRFDCSVDLIETVFDKIKKGNIENGYYSPRVMDIMLQYKWRVYSSLNRKKWNNGELSSGRYYRKMFEPQNILYAMKWKVRKFGRE